MVPTTAITIEGKARILGNGFGTLRAGQLAGRSEAVAVKEIRPKGDEEDRARVEVVSIDL